MGVRSLTSQLAAEVADVERRRRFVAVNVDPVGVALTGANGNGSAGATSGAARRVDADRAARRPPLPELVALRPGQDRRWKPPGGVAARFKVGQKEGAPGAAARPKAQGPPPEPADQPLGEGGNGSAGASRAPEPNADAITIELKSS